MKVNFTETVLRDANQSLIATRLPYNDFKDILKTLDRAGYYSLECWGGATFDSCLRYLNEDPWDRLRNIRKLVKNTKLQMLLRGQNLLGYKPYPDDVVRLFVKKSIENGIYIIRIFDALNDLRNIEVAVDETIKNNGHAQGTICFTVSPVHNLEAYVKLGKNLEDMGVNSICIKDMAGIMSPKDAYELVKALKENVSVPVFLHTHSTTGLGPMTCLKAVEAGCDGIDTSISCFSGGTSQPSTEAIYHSIKQLGYDVDLDTTVLKKINDFFKPIKEKLLESGHLNPIVMSTDTDALSYQVPGGMLSNLISQLKMQNALDKLEEVLTEIPNVRRDLGYPPLVTPLSQMVGVQATSNVLSGTRYSNISKEVSSYIRGEYGQAPAHLSDELVKKVLGDAPMFTGRFADTLPPQFESAKSELGKVARSDEDVLSYILFPQIAQKFFQSKGLRDDCGIDEVVSTTKKVAGSSAIPAIQGKQAITAPIPGTIIDIAVKAGDVVKKGQVLLIMEAMKMENEIKATCDGVIAEVSISEGASVSLGDTLITLR